MPQPVARLVDLVRSLARRHYLDLSPARVWPLALLVAYGIFAGFISNPGIDHPFDKLQHLVFFGLLTLAVHAVFCCRLRISAVVATCLGLAGELVQSLFPHREFSLGDIAANLIGVALIVAAIALLRSQRRAALAGGRAPAPEPDETAEAPQAQSTVSPSPSPSPSSSASRAPSSRASSSSVLSGTTTVTLPAARSISGTASRVKGT